MSKNTKELTTENLFDWISQHKTLSEDFKNYFGVSPENAKIEDSVICWKTIHINQKTDKIWKECGCDIENYIGETMSPNNTTWFAHGDNEFVCVDDGTGLITKLILDPIKKKEQKKQEQPKIR